TTAVGVGGHIRCGLQPDGRGAVAKRASRVVGDVRFDNQTSAADSRGAGIGIGATEGDIAAAVDQQAVAAGVGKHAGEHHRSIEVGGAGADRNEGRPLSAEVDVV